MNVWLDQMLPRRLCHPIQEATGIDVSHVGTRYESDRAIFGAAREEEAVILTKDSDFLRLLERHGPPPRVIWLTCGNCSNQELERILVHGLPEALDLLEQGEAMVEITGRG